MEPIAPSSRYTLNLNRQNFIRQAQKDVVKDFNRVTFVVKVPDLPPDPPSYSFMVVFTTLTHFWSSRRLKWELKS